MHEYALAESVVKAAIDAAENDGHASITRIDVRIGELQRIDKEVFAFALSEVIPANEARIAGVEVNLEIEPARFRCRPCGREFTLAETGGPLGHDQAEAIHFVPELAHAFLACPACDSPDFEVAAGRGVSIENMEAS
ncbi:MAG: hydrogenase nickel incorporation protein HypA [Planctomycetota bacterium]|jgi:hydrogenase nickel incorporation protein HypA/HybF